LGKEEERHLVVLLEFLVSYFHDIKNALLKGFLTKDTPVLRTIELIADVIGKLELS
jgi:hypothetical protein